VALAARCAADDVAFLIHNGEYLVAVVFFHEVAVFVYAKLCLLSNNTRAKGKFYRHGRQKRRNPFWGFLLRISVILQGW
jgi:hypothetical protein